MSQSIKRISTFTVALSMLVSSSGTWAQTPNDLFALVNIRGRDGESQMADRAYVQHHTSKSGAAAYSYWWNSREKPVKLHPGPNGVRKRAILYFNDRSHGVTADA